MEIDNPYKYNKKWTIDWVYKHIGYCTVKTEIKRTDNLTLYSEGMF